MFAQGYRNAKPLHGGLDAWNVEFAHELRRPRDEDEQVAPVTTHA
jgi:hypothetical protein